MLIDPNPESPLFDQVYQLELLLLLFVVVVIIVIVIII